MTQTRSLSNAAAATPLPVRRASVWFGILAGPVAWTLQGLLGWFFGERICTSMSIGGVRTTMGAIGVIAFAAAAAGAMAGWRNLRQAAGSHPAHTEAWDLAEFMSLAGLLVSSVFALGIFWAALPALMLSHCGHVR